MELLSERPKSITVLHFGDLQSLKCRTVVAQKWNWIQFRVLDFSLVSDFAVKMWLPSQFRRLYGLKLLTVLRIGPIGPSKGTFWSLCSGTFPR